MSDAFQCNLNNNVAFSPHKKKPALRGLNDQSSKTLEEPVPGIHAFDFRRRVDIHVDAAIRRLDGDTIATRKRHAEIDRRIRRREHRHIEFFCPSGRQLAARDGVVIVEKYATAWRASAA
ncbi:hypothetical protein G3N59_16855 [Paraburkholderia sp. Ac-20340]|uniref:hypothetical protein n=1 Tax=Paraburkholderia sp. Ac-20340 TaxID=2703888 RepID=UPI001981F3A6|nr:hypothetical protein [Paraburkholderia sp. Ac-20340]MBN3855054.1 hypothetical protein [Paraburkholderia sp. Ac-20340]